MAAPDHRSPPVLSGDRPQPQYAPPDSLAVVTVKRKGWAGPGTDPVQEDLGFHLCLLLPPLSFGERLEGRGRETKSRGGSYWARSAPRGDQSLLSLDAPGSALAGPPIAPTVMSACCR